MLFRDTNKDLQTIASCGRAVLRNHVIFHRPAAARHWPRPVHYLSNMLKVASFACLTFALLRRERFADANLNYWNEALAYIATAVFLDYFEAR